MINEYATAALNYNFWQSIYRRNQLISAEYAPNLTAPPTIESCLSQIGYYFSKLAERKIGRSSYWTHSYEGRTYSIINSLQFGVIWREKLRRAQRLLSKDPNLPEELESISECLHSIDMSNPKFKVRMVNNKQMVSIDTLQTEFEAMIKVLEKACLFTEFIHSKWSRADLLKAVSAGKFPNIKGPTWAADEFKCANIRLVSYRRRK